MSGTEDVDGLFDYFFVVFDGDFSFLFEEFFEQSELDGAVLEE